MGSSSSTTITLTKRTYPLAEPIPYIPSSKKRTCPSPEPLPLQNKKTPVQTLLLPLLSLSPPTLTPPPLMKWMLVAG